MATGAGQGEAHTFPSRRDLWITLVLWAYALSVLWIAGRHLVCSTADGGTKLLGFLGLAAIGLAPLWLLYGTSYAVTDTELLLRTGPCVIRVPLHRVRGVQDPPRSRWRGLAFGFSADLIMVEYDGFSGGARISPADKAGFIGVLRERCPGLREAGG